MSKETVPENPFFHCAECGQMDWSSRTALSRPDGELVCWFCAHRLRGGGRGLNTTNPTNIDYFIDVDSPSSKLIIGVYPEGTTQDEVEAVAKQYATFGGYFRRWGGGRFEYVAWTE